jgi:hypothetical protein
VKPAFETTRGAVAFLCLVFLCVTWPALWPARWLPPKEESYAAMPDLNPMDFVARQIYHESGPIDVLLIGSSRMWTGVNAATLQRYFEQELGRPCTVLTLGWQYAGFDETWFVFRDLLAHRKVRLAVLSREWDPNPQWRGEPHRFLYRSCRYSEDAPELAGLAPAKRLAIYGTSIFGMPRTLLSLVRPALPMNPGSPHSRQVETHFHSSDFRATQGSLIARTVLGGLPMPAARPPSPAGPDKVLVYGDSTRERFHFGDEISEYHRFFLEHIRRLAAETHTRLTMLHIPSQAERHGGTIDEPANWPALLGPDATVLGIAPDDFWGGLTDEQVGQFCVDFAHLNEHGQAVLTAAIAPALLQAYEKQ